MIEIKIENTENNILKMFLMPNPLKYREFKTIAVEGYLFCFIFRGHKFNEQNI